MEHNGNYCYHRWWSRVEHKPPLYPSSPQLVIKVKHEPPLYPSSLQLIAICKTTAATVSLIPTAGYQGETRAATVSLIPTANRHLWNNSRHCIPHPYSWSPFVKQQPPLYPSSPQLIAISVIVPAVLGPVPRSITWQEVRPNPVAQLQHAVKLQWPSRHQKPIPSQFSPTHITFLYRITTLFSSFVWGAYLWKFYTHFIQAMLFEPLGLLFGIFYDCYYYYYKLILAY